jgi:hypothetical protein
MWIYYNIDKEIWIAREQDAKYVWSNESLPTLMNSLPSDGEIKIRPAFTQQRDPHYCPRCGRRKRAWRSFSADMLCLECVEREERDDREEPGVVLG